MIYHAIVNGIPYLDVRARNDDEARGLIKIRCQNDYFMGFYRRWRDAGMHVAEFKRGLKTTKEEVRNGRPEDRTKALRVQV